ncbi:MAG: sugar phosphate nucleotidyltransferase [Planctomycetes bacterium]|jgi:glucose-1-phosphate adenylyltransferase|nr:sugar phosphate nucleotidyltransferase [Planctomycetota bacterium]
MRERRLNDDVTVVILGGGRGSRLFPLTKLRSKPAVPLAGKYRLIDVPISNALHSGMERIFILTQFNSVSLHRHIADTYKFAAFSRGFVEILAAQQTPSDDRWFQGTADAVAQNLRFICSRPGGLVLVLSGDHLYRMDYGRMVARHRESGRDVTLAVLPCSEEEIAEFGAVRVDGAGNVLEFREKPATPGAREGMAVPPDLARSHDLDPRRPYLASMGVYLFSEAALADSLAPGMIDFGRHVLPAAVKAGRVAACFFDGYWRDIGTIRSFYEAHLDLVSPTPPFDFYDPGWMIYTHPRFLPGSRLDEVRLDRCVIADGVIAERSEISSSVVGIRAVLRGAVLRRTLIMGADEEYPDVPGAPPVGIGEGSLIEDAIVDKNARVGRDVRIPARPGRPDSDGPAWVVRDGIVVIPKNAVLPDRTVI